MLARLSALILLCSSALSQFGVLAPGAPGDDAHWPTAAKQGFGTSYGPLSKVWFTLAEGVLTEVFYPTLDTPNVQSLQLIVVDGERVETERENTKHRVEIPDSRSLTFRQVNTAKSGSYSIRKTYVTDPEQNVLLIDLEFGSRNETSVYVYYDPSLNNSGMHDTAWLQDGAMLAQDAEVSSALVFDCGVDSLGGVSSGFLGRSDGLTELRRNSSRIQAYQRAEDGNVVQLAMLAQTRRRDGFRCTLALGFAATADEAARAARTSLAKGFFNVRHAYESEWRKYLGGLKIPTDNYMPHTNMAAMVLKALEDKTHRGAMIASPSNPWGAGPNANEPNTTGYHAVWSRDLYHAATAFMALGDEASANRALDFLLKVQQNSDGSFPQNSRVDGRAIGGAVQMDQVAWPIILAYQLRRNDAHSWSNHIKPAADFILRHGPTTEQERWEEERGFSPSTIAAQIAALVCAARLAETNNDRDSQRAYLATADEWARDVTKWTITTNGLHHEPRYYLRITEDDDPNDGATVNINSGGGDFDERAIVDAGFLELVRLGIKSPRDPIIRRSLTIVDRVIRQNTPNGPAWYRYNHDAYGERNDAGGYDGKTGRGRPWPLLSGERGEYELALGNRIAARRLLDSLMAFANEGRMIPEQIWDGTESTGSMIRGEGTGSATPLAWSMAQFIRLHANVRAGRNLETPEPVRERYLKAR